MLVSIFLRSATVRLAGVATSAERHGIYSYRSNNNLHKFARPATRSNSFDSFVFVFLPAGTEIPKSIQFFSYSRQWRAVLFLVVVFPLSSAEDGGPVVRIHRFWSIKARGVGNRVGHASFRARAQLYRRWCRARRPTKLGSRIYRPELSFRY